MILMVIAVLTIVSGAEAKNYFYGDQELSMESNGYLLFTSDNILNTVDEADRGVRGAAAHCVSVDENTAKHIGDISVVRSDNRLSIDVSTKISYSAACNTYYSVIDRLKTADDIRRLWLLFADSATDEYAAETIKKSGDNEDVSTLIEMRRLSDVSKYIEFFYAKNKDWKLTDYTFLSQAFKSRKDKTLSPAYIQFITALLTGDAEKAFHVVKSIDLDNLGFRFAEGSNDRMKISGKPVTGGQPAMKSL